MTGLPNTNNDVQNTAAAAPANPLQPIVDLKNEVKEGIAAAIQTPRDRVIAALVEDEVAKRTRLLQTGLIEYEKLEKEFRGIRPDNIVYDENEKEVSSSWSRPQAQKRKQAKEKLEKLLAALSDAITAGNYEKLKNLVGKNEGKSDGKSDVKAEE